MGGGNSTFNRKFIENFCAGQGMNEKFIILLLKKKNFIALYNRDGSGHCHIRR